MDSSSYRFPVAGEILDLLGEEVDFRNRDAIGGPKLVGKIAGGFLDQA